jgi:hypothetical protein
VTVAESFPLGLAKALRRHKFKVRLRDGSFFPERAIKSADEIKKISAALLMAEVGLSEGIHALRRTRIGKARRLMLNQAPLTAERLRAIIDTAILQAGGNTTHTIVARQDMEALAMICRASNIERPLFVTLAVLCCGGSDAMAQAENYGKLYTAVPVEAAQRAMRFYKVRKSAGPSAAAA